MAQFGKSEWMIEGTPLAYTRISTNDQDKSDTAKTNAKKKPTLIKQFKFINQRLKMEKMPEAKASNWFAEVASGTNRNRGQWQALQMRAQALAAEGKRPFIVVQDPSRFARNTRHAMVAIDSLHESSIPVYAVREGLQTGSKGDLHPTEELIFLQLLGSSAYVSQVQKEKADQSVSSAKEEGTMSARGMSLFPFASIDPMEVYHEHIDVLNQEPYKGEDGKWYGGPNAHATIVSNITGENGPTINAVKTRLRAAEVLARGGLTDKEYKSYMIYRTKIRDILKDLGSDPYATTSPAGKYSFPAQALMMMVGRSLQDPTKFRQRTNEEIETYLKDPKPYLSVKDSGIWKSTIGKR